MNHHVRSYWPHRKLPIVPELLFEVLERVNEKKLWGERVGRGMFQTYIQLLKVHGLIEKDYSTYYPLWFPRYRLTTKGKRQLCRKCQEVYCAVEIEKIDTATFSYCPKLRILIARQLKTKK
jgi:hypothetical protein